MMSLALAVMNLSLIIHEGELFKRCLCHVCQPMTSPPDAWLQVVKKPPYSDLPDIIPAWSTGILFCSYKFHNNNEKLRKVQHVMERKVIDFFWKSVDGMPHAICVWRQNYKWYFLEIVHSDVCVDEVCINDTHRRANATELVDGNLVNFGSFQFKFAVNYDKLRAEHDQEDANSENAMDVDGDDEDVEDVVDDEDIEDVVDANTEDTETAQRLDLVVRALVLMGCHIPKRCIRTLDVFGVSYTSEVSHS